MFSNIRQKISDLLTNQSNGTNELNAPQISLLEKIGGVFNNFGGAATTTGKSSPHRFAQPSRTSEFKQ